MTTVLAVDPGTGHTRGHGCGIARVEFNYPVQSRVILEAGILSFHSQLVKFDKAETRAQRMAKIRHALGNLAVGVPDVYDEPDLLAVEDQTGPAVGAQRAGQWGASNLPVVMVQGLVYGLGLPVIEVSPQQAKAAVAGSRNADKAQVKRAVTARIGASRAVGLSEHEFDAVAIAIAAFGKWRNEQAKKGRAA